MGHLIGLLLVVAAALTPEAVSVPRSGGVLSPARRHLLQGGGPREVRGDLAEALLDGTVDEERNVRLFDSLFTVADGSVGAIPVGSGRRVGGHGDRKERRQEKKKRRKYASVTAKAEPKQAPAQEKPQATIESDLSSSRGPALPELSAEEPILGGAPEMRNKCSNKTHSPCNVCHKCCHPYVPDGPLCDECFEQQCPARPTPSPTMRPLTPEEKAARDANKRHLEALARGPGLKVLASGQEGWTAVYVDPQNGYAEIDSPLPVSVEGGALSVTDSSNGGPVWYWKSPKVDANKYPLSGNMDSLYDGLLSFQLQRSPLGTNEPIASETTEGTHSLHAAKRYQTYGDIILRGGHENSKRTLVFFFSRYAPTNREPKSKTPTYYDVRLAPLDGDPAEGQPWVERTDVYDKDATEEDIKDVLSGLDFMLIRGRYQTGKETSMISNIELKGCPLKCNNGGKLIRDRCVCHCRKGYVGDRCNQRVQFDMESLTDKGHRTRKCLTICRPKLVVTDSGQETKLSCKQEHNTMYYSSAVPIVMLTQCQGHSNQLFFSGQGDAKNGSWYESVALRGYCLGVENLGVMKSLKSVEWRPNGHLPLTITMCSKYSSNDKWKTQHVRYSSEDTNRLILAPRNSTTDILTNSTGMCIGPHYAWDTTCEDPKCNLLGSSDGVERQAVVRECNNNIKSDRFLVRQSQYLMAEVTDHQREPKPVHPPDKQKLTDQVSSTFIKSDSNRTNDTTAAILNDWVQQDLENLDPASEVFDLYHDLYL